MKILVANLGSTSFKYRLFDMADERQLARGGIERVGSKESRGFVDVAGHRHEFAEPVPDHAVAVRKCLEQLTDPMHGCLKQTGEVAGIGFKAVHPGSDATVVRVTPEVLADMEAMNAVAPAHNPPYVAAMRLLAEKLPEIPLVAAFETGFHQSIPDRNRFYGAPYEWATQHQVRRYGFHGASHRFIGGRIAELLGRDNLRVISCHLGGSSSLCAIRAGQSMATSMGMSPQSGTLHNNRVGDFDPFALPVLMQQTGRTLAELLDELASRGGLLGLSGTSGDVRDLEKSAACGDVRARLALDVFVGDVRRHLGSLLVELGGLDALVFTGGIGENGAGIRAGVCQGLEELGITLDAAANDSAGQAGSVTSVAGSAKLQPGERPIHAATSRAQIWIVPTNEELVVARQTKEHLESYTQ
ncbi:MAG: acetate/propionate family kinase [Pirellulales bacterium]|nr:acetate/propionate family kinase [Pirellulales bacterium]